GTPRQALIFFLEGDAVEELGDVPIQIDYTEASKTLIRGLKEELEATRARLRVSREEFESANEELRAANEELQSVNEELQTVNAELKIKLDGVSRANNDMQNLMAATEVGTLFLDSQLHI